MSRGQNIGRGFLFASSFAAGAFVFGGVNMSCGSVQSACADSCPAGPEGPVGPQGPAGPPGPEQWTAVGDNLSFANSVGIGTTSPQYRLHVVNAQGYGQLTVAGSTAADLRLGDLDAPANTKEVLLRSQNGTTQLLSLTDLGGVTKTILIADHATGGISLPSLDSGKAGAVCITATGALWVDTTGADCI